MNRNDDVNDGVEEVSIEEYLYDLQSYMVQDDQEMENILNENLEIIVGDKLYQMTRIGTFKIDLDKILEYRALYHMYEDEILYDIDFRKIPSEIVINSEESLVQEGVARLNQAYNVLEQDPTGTGNDQSSGNGGPVTSLPGTVPTSSLNLQFITTTVGDDFDKEIKIQHGTKRLHFATFKTNFLGLGVLRTVGQRAKLQKEKRIFGIKYWGESYADELICGVDNLDLKTTYVFPTPQYYYTFQKPKFNGIIHTEIGNYAFDALNIEVNTNALGYSLNNTNSTRFVNHQFNSWAGGVFNNWFTSITDQFLSSIDASYPVKYKENAKRIESIQDANRFRISLDNTAKPQGYSHVNVWRYDWNIGFGGAQYEYEIQAGSFWGVARVGTDWYAARIIRQ